CKRTPQLKQGALSLNTKVRDHWQVYFCPDCDFYSRYSVRIAREVASGTKENRLRLTIGFYQHNHIFGRCAEVFLGPTKLITGTPTRSAL
ncbi:hypothetical protein, partial [Candidatus Villigracilis saccharophilus]|uniref:hypothetical protein n=1 Tax=Candidatus Villigracilis saccharophilus TaxID=3140684 RepID=UPI0031F19FA3